MDAGIVIKPIIGAVASDYAQSSIGSGRNAPSTVLPPEKTVAPAANAQAPRNDQARASPTQNQVIIDPQTRDVIFRVIDVSSRQVLRQMPDEAMLRIRAYARAISNSNRPVETENKPDFKA